MIKKLSLLLFVFFISCEIQYDGETKLVFKGRLIDEQGTAISNKDVFLYANRDYIYFPFVFYAPGVEDQIGQATTDANGNYSMVFPKPTGNYSEIIVVINDDSNNYEKKQYVNITLENFENYKIEKETVLYQKSSLSNLNIIPNQISSKELINIEFIGAIYEEFEFLTFPGNYYYEYQFNKKVKKNQNLIIKYTLKDYSNNSTETLEETITITNSDNTDFTLTY